MEEISDEKFIRETGMRRFLVTSILRELLIIIFNHLSDKKPKTLKSFFEGTYRHLPGRSRLLQSGNNPQEEYKMIKFSSPQQKKI